LSFTFLNNSFNEICKIKKAALAAFFILWNYFSKSLKYILMNFSPGVDSDYIQKQFQGTGF